MLQILTITSPIFLLIATGFLSVRFGVFRREDMRLLGKLLVNYALPALVFRAISQFPLEQVLNLRYLAVYGGGSLLALLIGTLYGRLRGSGQMPQIALIGMGMAASNSVFVGFPIISQLVGSQTQIALALCLLVENLLIIPLTLLISDTNAQLPWYQSLLRSLRGLLRSPIFLAILAGFASSATGLQVPSVVDRTLQIGAGAAGPVALFMIGGVLVGQRISGIRVDLVAVVSGKLLLHPACILLALWCLPPLEPELKMAAILFACMPLPAVYTALAQKYHLDGFAATMLVASTVASFITINSWIWILH